MSWRFEHGLLLFIRFFFYFAFPCIACCYLVPSSWGQDKIPRSFLCASFNQYWPKRISEGTETICYQMRQHRINFREKKFRERSNMIQHKRERNIPKLVKMGIFHYIRAFRHLVFCCTCHLHITTNGINEKLQYEVIYSYNSLWPLLNGVVSYIRLIKFPSTFPPLSALSLGEKSWKRCLRSSVKSHCMYIIMIY